jgi:disulfide bond formation protein DsbB
MQPLITLARHRLYWLALLLLGITLEATALVFQHVLDYPPCVMCIHVRLWVVLLILIAIFGLVVRNIRCAAGLSHLLMTGVMAGLLERAWQLLGTERGFIISTCGFDTGLPSWLALDKWLPAVFEVQTTCGYTPELVFGITMAEFLLVMSACLGLLSLLMALVVLIFTPE